MANRTIAGLTADTTPARTDVIPKQVSTGATEAEKSTIAQILALSTVADISDASANGRSLISAADYAAMKALLNLEIGTDVQAQDAELAAIAGLTSAADKGIQFTGSGTAATYDLTAAGKALLDDADAAAQRATLDLEPGTDMPAAAFTTIAVSGQSDVVADGVADTLTLAAGSNITITTNASTDTVTITASGGGASALDDLSDVVISTPASGHILVHNGTNFVNQAELSVSVSGVSDGYILGRASSAPAWRSPANARTDLGLSANGSSLVTAADYAAMRTLLDLESGTDFNVAASDSAAGIVELAIASEVNTGTDTTRATTCDAIAGSYAGTKAVSLPLAAAPDTAQATGDGAAWFVVPACLNGMNLVGVVATVATAGTTGTSDYQLRRVRAGTPADMLSTKVTIDSTETSSTSAATAAVIDAANDDVQTGDLIYVDIDAVSTTPPEGGAIGLEFRLP